MQCEQIVKIYSLYVSDEHLVESSEITVLLVDD
jgi:hypothetical protein